MQTGLRTFVAFVAFTFLSFSFGVLGCKKEFPLISPDECPKLVEHSKALLGEGVKDKTDDEMLAVCLASTARQRGCVKMATKGSDIMKCSLVLD